MKVSKFGGSSLADAGQFKRVQSIVLSDPDRQYIVVSAPGKRNPQDHKITDLLYEWQRLEITNESSEKVQKIIQGRFEAIVGELGINLDIEKEFKEIAGQVGPHFSPAFVASRGEYLSGKILSMVLNYEFVDPVKYIRFDSRGNYIKDDLLLRRALQGKRAVIPGFYGGMPDDSVVTFSRGGSDITGAIVARAVDAAVYENWTDVSGLLMADPRIVENPRKIEVVTYRELRELSYMGANVFHEEAMFPVMEAKIPTNIRNTNIPDNEGTLIVTEDTRRKNPGTIIGVAGRKDFTVITVEKMLMNQLLGFGRRILTVLDQNNISFEHMPSGIDTMSVIIDNRQINGKLDRVLSEIKVGCEPDHLTVSQDNALIAVVGRPMIHSPGVAAKVFTAIAKKGINIRMINQGSSEISIIIGVANADYEKTIQAVYEAFVT